MALTVAEEREVDRLIDRELVARAIDERARQQRALGREPSAGQHAAQQRSEYLWPVVTAHARA